MTNILVFARLTLLEASRRKVLWALLGLAVLIIGLSFWGFARLPAVHAFGTSLSAANSHLVTAQLLGFVLFALSFVGALAMSFVAAPTIAGELESGVALSLLACSASGWAWSAWRSATSRSLAGLRLPPPRRARGTKSPTRWRPWLYWPLRPSSF